MHRPWLFLAPPEDRCVKTAGVSLSLATTESLCRPQHSRLVLLGFACSDPRISRGRPRGGLVRHLAEPLETRPERGASARHRLSGSVRPRGLALANPPRIATLAGRLAVGPPGDPERFGRRSHLVLLRTRADDGIELRVVVEQRIAFHDHPGLCVSRGARDA